MSDTKLNQLVQELGTQTGLTGLTLDEAGYCMLGFDDKVNVQIQSEPALDRVVIFCALGFLKPEDNKAYVLEKLMVANLYWEGTDGATLSFDAKNQYVLLAYRLDVTHIDVEVFTAVINDFVDTCDVWIDRLDALKKQGAEAAVQGALPSGIVRV